MTAIPKPAEALTWTTLAAKLGVSRQALSNWSGRPDAPLVRGVAEWRAYIDENALAFKGHHVGHTAGELKEEKLKWEIELLKAKDAREKRKVIDREEVNRLLLETSTRGRTMLYQFMETEAPPKLDGMSAVQMRPILREMADAIAEQMAAAFEKFQQQ